MKLIMERAKYEDVEALVHIYHTAYSENEKLGFPASASKVTVNEVQMWTKNTIVLIVRIEDTRTIIGTVRLKFHEDWHCYVLGRLAVMPNCKGMGVATRLMRYVEKELLQINEKIVRLTVAKGHSYLPQVYIRKGYKIIDEIILEDLPYDEFIMEKTL